MGVIKGSNMDLFGLSHTSYHIQSDALDVDRGPEGLCTLPNGCAAVVVWRWGLKGAIVTRQCVGNRGTEWTRQH